jgi:dipeptidyl-peptidase-4
VGGGEQSLRRSVDAEAPVATTSKFVALGCALVAGLQPTSARAGLPAFASSPLLSGCLPLRSLRARARSLQARQHTGSMAASAGYAQSRYMPAQVDSTISYEDIATFPRPGCSAPDSIAFSPDDSVVTYLASSDGSLSRQLYAMDVANGQVRELCKPPSGTGEEETFSLEEKLRRERARQLHTGITSYAWAEGAEDAGKILVPIGNELFVQEGLNGGLQRLFDPSVLLPSDAQADGNLPPILDARISADGKMVGFVWDRELYVVSTDCKSMPRQLTHGVRGTELTNGLADYIAQEEMDRYEGYWISPDSSMVAFEQVDESHIAKYRIMHQGSESVGESAQEDHHYPFAGAANPVVRLGVVATAGGDVRWFDLTSRFGADFYLARVKWFPDMSLVLQIQNREQTEVELLHVNPQTGESKTLFVEQSKEWINLHNMLTPLKKEAQFLWASERTGYQHLYLYDTSGNLVRQLTDGEWIVEDVKSVDENTGLVYFVGTKSGWLERHLYTVPLGGGEMVQITQEPGMHNVIIDHKRQLFVDQYSSSTKPFRVNVCSLADGSVVRMLYVNKDPRLQRLTLATPTFVTLPSSDGKVPLQAEYVPISEYVPNMS